MKLTSYLYRGPRSAASVRHEGGVLDVALVPGAVVELPAGHGYTESLQALGYLSPVPAKPARAPSTATKGGK
ncbi:hypothetical protein H0A70_05150 [Alcaligenaceae bacterium]|nr:hypothetical protein [Alcaligenaceae bacterium]